MADSAGVAVEFQRLHGMGEALYAAAQDELGEIAVRTYAPVGAHQDLLPYLVRRLLENGANTSFVHQLLDEETPPERVVSDPLSLFTGVEDFRHPRIPKPEDMYGDRRNSLGVDVTQAMSRASLLSALDAVDGVTIDGCPIIAGRADPNPAGAQVKSPFDTGRIVGQTCESSAAQINRAFTLARDAQAFVERQRGRGAFRPVAGNGGRAGKRKPVSGGSLRARSRQDLAGRHQ